MPTDPTTPPPPADPSSEPAKPPEEDKPKSAGDVLRGFSVDVGTDVEAALRSVRERAAHYLKKGQHTTVRVKFRGKEVATMPLSVLVAAEAATFIWAAPLRLWLLAANVVGRAVLEVEFINEADNLVTAGKARLLDGELDEALARFREAITMDRDHPAAHLNVGIALKLRGEREEAVKSFERARDLDPNGDVGKEARRQLELLKPRVNPIG